MLAGLDPNSRFNTLHSQTPWEDLCHTTLLMFCCPTHLTETLLLVVAHIPSISSQTTSIQLQIHHGMV